MPVEKMFRSFPPAKAPVGHAEGGHQNELVLAVAERLAGGPCGLIVGDAGDVKPLVAKPGDWATYRGNNARTDVARVAMAFDGEDEHPAQ